MKPQKDDGGQESDPEKENLRALYAKLRREFTAADLQKFTEIDEGIPIGQVLAELEAIHKKETGRRKA